MTATSSPDWRFDTKCVHTGEGVDTDTRAIRRPIHMANSYELPTNIEELAQVFSWEHLDKFQYTREHSATPRYLEERLAALEGSEDCIVTSSGMGAVSAALFTLLNSGDHIVASEICYTGTQKLLAFHAPRFGVQVSMVDSTDLQAVQDAIRPNTKAVFVETPGNPLVSISDIRAIADIAHDAGATLRRRQYLVGTHLPESAAARGGRRDSQRDEIHQRARRCARRRHHGSQAVPGPSAGVRGRPSRRLYQSVQRLAHHARDRDAAAAHAEARGERPHGRSLPGVARARAGRCAIRGSRAIRSTRSRRSKCRASPA